MFLLYAIEGTDRSGKQTQCNLVYEFIQEVIKRHNFQDRINLIKLSYPVYDNPSSFLVKEYLSGKFGEDASKVDNRMASLFYAVDRCHHFHTEIKPHLSEDTVTIAISDRYVGSNYIHQGCKLKTNEEIKTFIEFNSLIEHEICGIPEPTKTFFLDVPPEVSLTLRKNELLKNGMSKDIHENDDEHIKQAYDKCSYIAQLKDWTTIKCTVDGVFRPREVITGELITRILSDINELF